MDNLEKQEDVFEIPVRDLFPNFTEHINLESNKRIFVSGKFGIGKTYFLNEFFKSYEDKYEIFHLFPAYYQINSNEDIIELLKYDILVELTRKNGDLFKQNKINGFKDSALLFYIWAKTNVSLLKISSSIIPVAASAAALYDPSLAQLSRLGRPLEEVVNLIDNFKKFKKNIEAGEQKFIDEFLRKFNGKKISETDYFSELLREKIVQQKTNKQSILILDDLDRIDPEHIFRILNIFSAHLDLENNNERPNKFGFDKILLVGDRQNIESIFHHKYGSHTNFNGYFNKFFSVKTYYFNNEKLVSNYIDAIIAKMRSENKILTEALGLNGLVRIFLNAVLIDWLFLNTKEKLNLRQLLMFSKFDKQLLKDGDYRSDDRDSISLEILQFANFAIKVLITIADGEDNLLRILSEIKNNKSESRQGRLHRSFLRYLFEETTGEKFEDENQTRIWRDYVLKLDRNLGKYLQITNTSKHKSSDKLFYDLLIEYIKQGLYLKNKTELGI